MVALVCPGVGGGVAGAWEEAPLIGVDRIPVTPGGRIVGGGSRWAREKRCVRNFFRLRLHSSILHAVLYSTPSDIEHQSPHLLPPSTIISTAPTTVADMVHS